MNAQTYTDEPIPKRLPQLSSLQVFAGGRNSVFIIVTADSTRYIPAPFGYYTGSSFLYINKWDGSSFSNSPLFIDTADYFSTGLYGNRDEFNFSAAEDSSERLFVAWVKQRIDLSDIQPQFYREPILKIAIEQNGNFQRISQIQRGNRPHFIFDHVNQGHLIWEQVAPIHEFPRSSKDSNFIIYSSSISYAEVQSDGSLGTIQNVGKGFRPRILVDFNNDLHFFWLDADSSTSQFFKLMHCQLIAEELTDAVMIKDSIRTIKQNGGWEQSVLPTINYFIDSAGNSYAAWTELQGEAGTIYFVQHKNDNTIDVRTRHVDTLHSTKAGFYVQSNGTIHCVWTEEHNRTKRINIAKGTALQPLFTSIRSFQSLVQEVHIVESSDRKVHCVYEDGISGIFFMRDITDSNNVIFPLVSMRHIRYNYSGEYYHPVAIDGNNQVWIAYSSNDYSYMEGLVRIHQRTTDIKNISASAPINYYLYQNYPNPFNLETSINFHLSDAGFVALKIFDILGREIATLVNEQLSSGNYSIPFRTRNLSSGIYFYRLDVAKTNVHNANKFTSTRRMLLLK